MNANAAVSEPMSQLEIRKGADAALAVGGLRFVACRREVDVVDGGITLYVNSALPGDDRELLRFDLFRNRPHYHAPAENAQETGIPSSTEGGVREWVIDQLSRRAGELVEEAGFHALRAQLDPAAIAAAPPALRRLLDGLAEPTEISYFPIPTAKLEALKR
ncbi:MAG: hypothetical protein IPK00_15280 [Deltaproteobacteria bacterium]|nr:hypothetical protein [Deltaproteobacteria bacterium]